jgi:hypothetical protein
VRYSLDPSEGPLWTVSISVAGTKSTRGRIPKETWSVGPYAGADYNLTLSHIVVDFEVQLSTLTMTNLDECFANYSKMEQPIEKRKSTRKGKGRGGS